MRNESRGTRHLAVVGGLVALVMSVWLIAACGAEGAPRDPGAHGPFGVGMTERTFTRTSSTTGQPRVLKTVIWYPIDDASSATAQPDATPATKHGPYPIVMFSHGASGEPTHASYLTEQLASWGFVVVAPPHPGNTRDDGACNTECLADSYLNRVADIEFVLDQVITLKDKPSDALGKIVDPERTASTGFSFGGMTAVRTIADHRFDVVVGIAPAAPVSLIDIGKKLDVPLLMTSGGEDIAVPADQVKQLYDALPDSAPHYLLYFPKAHHTNFQDQCQEACDLPPERGHDLIRRYVTAFLETYLIGDKKFLKYLEQGEAPDVELSKGGA